MDERPIAICLCPNGVQADDPTRFDVFSQAGLRLAIKLRGQVAWEFVINYDIPKIKADGSQMGDTTTREVQAAGVLGFVTAEMRSYNAISVVQSHAEHCASRGLK